METERNRRSKIVSALWHGLSSPDLVREPRPSLRQVCSYAWNAPWAPETGVTRFLGKAYGCLVAVPFIALLWTLAWIVERPGRNAVAWAFALVLIVAGPGAWALAAGINAAQWLLALLDHTTNLLDHLTGRG